MLFHTRMNYMNRWLSVFILCLLTVGAHAQSLDNIGVVKNEGAKVVRFVLDDSTYFNLHTGRPLFSFRMNGVLFESDDVQAGLTGNRFVMIFPRGVDAGFISRGGSHPGWMAELVIQNNGSDTVRISDVVPFGENRNNVCITGHGPAGLARASLFLPGRQPLRVIMPDNAWEAGFSAFDTDTALSVCAIARRTTLTGGVKTRYESVLPPGASVTYKLYADVYKGPWQEGLRLMFRDRYLYDLTVFDNNLYERDDLKWIRKSYLIILQMAWDRQFYDRFTAEEGFGKFIEQYNRIFGYTDVWGIWPTWPRLGLDERNQWELYRDLPGGLNALQQLSLKAKMNKCRFFISYNPWDNSTNAEDHLKGMASLIAAAGADGVVLDTRGASSRELQMTADSVREGVIMYSEGMAVIKDMPGIIAGRVHNALFLSPELNLNRLIKPEFSIFRVADVGEDILHREISVAFFNGHGTELNLFRPGGRDDDYFRDLDYLAKTTFILRQNHDAFTDKDWVPLLNTADDLTYVNKWVSGAKQVYTVLNMNPAGVDTLLFEVKDAQQHHFVSLWRHEELLPSMVNGHTFIRAVAPGWDPGMTGTRRESSTDCIARLPVLIHGRITGNDIEVRSETEGQLGIWNENPGYASEPLLIASPADTLINVSSISGFREGRIIIQLTRDGILLDERIIVTEGGKPRLVSRVTRTAVTAEIPEGMVMVPSASFRYSLSANDTFIEYPSAGRETAAQVGSFLIDRYPVTNEEYLRFIKESRYVPSDTVNYLKHWENGAPVTGQERYPVVNVSLEDARAYAAWAGKRLPTESEWQLAAQGTDGRLWPWGNEFHATKCNNGFGRPTPVDAFPKGESPYGVADLVGNIWQITDDVYYNGAYYFCIIRGGSYYKPASGTWYIEGGPQPLNKTQMQLLVSPGYDRSSTVGFRCVKDTAGAGN